MEFEILDLAKILLEDTHSLEKVREYATRMGWMFVKMHKELVEVTQNSIEPIQEFFSNKKEIKMKYNHNEVFGYAPVDHKESLRFITADRLSEQPMAPGTCGTAMSKLIPFMDSLMYQLSVVLCKHLLYADIKLLGDMHNVPLLSSNKDVKKFGMFDIARYFNDGINRPTEEPNLNCAAHYDPGFVTLSILATAPGLQLKDLKESKWIDGPFNPKTGTNDDIGIIWFGYAAQKVSNGMIKAAIHRVTYPTAPSAPRTTMWYEVCTADQEPKPYVYILLLETHIKNLDSSKSNEIPPNIMPSNQEKKVQVKTIDVEKSYGVPRSKKIPEVSKKMEDKASKLLSVTQETKTPNNNVEVEFGVPISKRISLTVPNVFGEDGKPITISKKKENEPPAETLKKIEKKRGVPMSKSEY